MVTIIFLSDCEIKKKNNLSKRTKTIKRIKIKLKNNNIP